MCRHAAWLGAPRPLATLIHDPEHGLLKQSYAPRRQRHGTVNADGFGMGWYDPSLADPVRYRRSVPIWADANLPALAQVARSGCLLAAVRCATTGMPVEETATAPFTDGPWLLSHNGRVARDAVRDLADGAESACDSAWLAAAAFQRLRAGLALGEALAEVVAHAGAKDPGARLNLLACDGASLAATVWGDTLFCQRSQDGVLVASEPLDDLPGWQAVPERSLLLASPDGVRVQPL
ncbi:ergothioneine biosynthesis protein EgtC [Nonomuraea basaltis]|uniref:ergothioneine biosynthesis protein EgtC n=1 Tax=Nonomuraea basaltis TaxID=2495887 RepID=UPI00110C68A0|nr:ergothioneine biosynthesis protein EgtC [Nonomuraea basaltis]TMR98017.1 ergothioneine biosynthesis protein EgtC [Nonomuraea basaltis]